MKILVFIAGMPGAGKSIVSEEAKKMGFRVYNMGDIVREEVLKRGLEPTLENFMRIAEELRVRYGMNAIAKLLSQKIKSESLATTPTFCSNVVFIDGVRSLEEIETLKKELNAEVLIIAIHASPRTRYERLLKRGRPGDPKDWDEFKDRDFRELRWGLGNVIALADIMIVNEGTLDEFISSVKRILEEVRNRWCI